MPAPDAIHKLVERFGKHQHEFRLHKNETELRRESDAMDSQIDWLASPAGVICGLTEEEVKIVEGK